LVPPAGHRADRLPVEQEGKYCQKICESSEEDYHFPDIDALLAEEAVGGIEQMVPGRITMEISI
jgi:hypothetical protein